jgi:heme A synthase
MSIRLSAPKVITWVIAVVVGAIGILAHLGTIPVLSGYAFWLVVAAFVLLVLATLLKGL